MESDSSIAQGVLNFWFSEPVKKHWFKSTKKLDEEIRTKFENTWNQATANQLDNWKLSAKDTLALIIVLDQFPLNMFRGMAKSFSTEKKAIEVCYHALKNKFDSELINTQLSFLYMPLMHSENIEDQNLSVKLFEKAGLESNLRFAKHHRDIILKFGRFPHRNEILNRKSSIQELEYLASPRAFTG